MRKESIGIRIFGLMKKMKRMVINIGG